MSRWSDDRTRHGWRARGVAARGGAAPALARLLAVLGLATPALACLLAVLALATPALAADPPACATNGTPGDPVAGIAAAHTALPGHPFGVAVTPDGQTKFVALQPELGAGLGPLGQLLGLRAPGTIAVLSGRGSATRVLRTIDIGGAPQGLALTHDGRLLLATDYLGVTLVDVRAATEGAANPIVGRLADGMLGTAEVVLTPDDHYAFVSAATTGALSVYDLARARASTPMTVAAIGQLALGGGTAGLAMAPDGRHLLATSRVAAGSLLGATGTLSVIDALTAEHDPAHALVRSEPAGCGPERVALSPDGALAWVTARDSDALLVFDTQMLIGGQEPALRRWVSVGHEPLGLALINAGDVAVVADSNATAPAQEPQSLTLVNAVAALAGRPALLGSVSVGAFPRELALSADGAQLLATSYATSTLESIDAATLPEGNDPGTPPARPRLMLRVAPARVRAGHRVRLEVYVSAPATPYQPAQGMVGAVVRLRRTSVRTNRAGRARLGITLRSARRYRLTASRHGFVSATAHVTAVRRR